MQASVFASYGWVTLFIDLHIAIVWLLMHHHPPLSHRGVRNDRRVSSPVALLWAAQIVGFSMPGLSQSRVLFGHNVHVVNHLSLQLGAADALVQGQGVEKAIAV